MAKSFNEKLIELLKTDSRFVDDEGELVKAAVIDRAWKIDRDLISLLLSKPEIKGKFFDEIEGHWIFNINTFIEYIADKNFLANSYTPKGKHLKEHDKWKQEFLKEITEKFTDKTLEFKTQTRTQRYRLVGVPFYNNEDENRFRQGLFDVVANK
jgi:hypothetical protein